MFKVTPTVILLLFCHLLLGQPVFQMDSSKISHLNIEDKAETYPFLSADGLRLYFTSSRYGFGRIYLSKRKSLKQNFVEAVPLSNSIPDTFYAATFTRDELTTYLHKDHRLYISSRASKDEEFSSPILIEEIGRCYYAPAISPDGSELLAIRYWGCDSTMKGNNRIDHFIKNKDGFFNLYHSLSIDTKYEIGPGQFTKNGLSFYMTIQPTIPYHLRNEIDTCIVIKFKRNHLKDSFSTYTLFYTGYLHNRLSQVTFNKNETIMVGVAGNRWEWKKTNLIYYRIRKRK